MNINNRVIKFAVLMRHPRFEKEFLRLNNNQINEMGGFVIKYRDTDENGYKEAVRQYFKKSNKARRPMLKILIACKKLD